MIKIILYLLEKIPIRTKFGLSLADELKYLYYNKIGQFKKPKKCLCGGIIITKSSPPDGWITECDNPKCRLLIDED